MKKVLAILLALALVLSVGLLAGCKKDGGDKKNDEPTVNENLQDASLEDWATVKIDPEVADVRYHTVEAKDSSWSVEFGFPMNEFGLETSNGDYNLIANGYGGQTDIVTGDKTLGAYSYRTINYTQSEKSCAHYACAFSDPVSVTYKDWEGKEQTETLYGVFINCKANDADTLAGLEAIIASLTITAA